MLTLQYPSIRTPFPTQHDYKKIRNKSSPPVLLLLLFWCHRPAVLSDTSTKLHLPGGGGAGVQNTFKLLLSRLSRLIVRPPTTRCVHLTCLPFDRRHVAFPSLTFCKPAFLPCGLLFRPAELQCSSSGHKSYACRCVAPSVTEHWGSQQSLMKINEGKVNNINIHAPVQDPKGKTFFFCHDSNNQDPYCNQQLAEFSVFCSNTDKRQAERYLVCDPSPTGLWWAIGNIPKTSYYV